jgi:hypothetical protein
MYSCLFLGNPVFSYVLSLSNIMSVLKYEARKKSSLHGIGNKSLKYEHSNFSVSRDITSLSI